MIKNKFNFQNLQLILKYLGLYDELLNYLVKFLK